MIGVFDSGIGGVTVLKEIIKLPIKVRVEKIDIINYPFNQIMILDLFFMKWH